MEEFLIAYRKTHTEKEVQQMMHQIVIKSAKRTYTYRRKFANNFKTNPNEIKFPHERFPHEMRFHVGDTILYKKHKYLYVQMFVCQIAKCHMELKID